MMIYVCSTTSIEINQEGLRFKKTEKLMVGFQPKPAIHKYLRLFFSHQLVLILALPLKISKAKERKQVAKPSSYCANAANQVWTWDISYMPTKVVGQFYYLYMIEDIYSRKIVGAEVYAKETGEDAAKLLERTVINEKCSQEQLILHSDNGAPMKSQTLRSKMYELNLTSSYSRPRVSNDNPYSEALFRTVKYCPQWPIKGFESLEDVRVSVCDFTQWYNHEHRHSRIRFVTPMQRHQGEDKNVLNARHQLYLKMQQKNPRRWSKLTRNWKPIGSVLLNPDRVENKG